LESGLDRSGLPRAQNSFVANSVEAARASLAEKARALEARGRPPPLHRPLAKLQAAR
jgi:hypothetical protein